jgi:hypothetical protein
MVGRFMRSFGLTMAFAVMVSLLVSFTLTPTMCARWLKVKPRTEDEEHHVHDSKHSLIFGPIDRVYTRMLEWSMAHRGLIAGLAVLVLLSSVPIFRIVNVNFTPQDDQSEFDVSLRAPEGNSLEATEVIANRVATAIRRIPEVSYTMVTVAGDSAGTLNTAGIYVRLKELGERDRDQFAIMDEVRNELLPPVAKTGVRATLQAPGIAGGGGGGGQAQGDVMFVMQGPRLDELQRASNTLAARAREIPGLVDVDTSLRTGKPEVSVRLDRPKAADLGVQLSDAAEALRLLVGGDQVTTYNESGEQYEVHLRAEGQNRDSEAAIGRLTVPSIRLGGVPLEDIASFTQARRHPISPPQPPAPGDRGRQHASGDVTEHGAGAHLRRSGQARTRVRVPYGLHGAVARIEPHCERVPASPRAVAHLHVPGAGGAVRVVAASGDDPAVAAAHAALRADLDRHLRPVAQHLLGARHAGAVRRGEEELDADRPPTSCRGGLDARRRSSRPAAIACGPS